MTNNPALLEKIEQALQTVYDPDFPLVDIYTLGLIYEVKLDEEEESTRNAVLLVVPEYEVKIEITFDPMRGPKMIRDEDLQRMFE